MGYFAAIVKRCSELDELGQNYLSRLEFLSRDAICERIWNKANTLFRAAGEDFDKVPDWVASTVDGYIPYSCMSRNGRLYYKLGYSVVAQDALLRNLLEIVEGRESIELDFPCVVEKQIVDKYCDL
jgi:hypothetical protein